MTILLTRDPAAFADRAGDFLQTRVECNILATVLTAVRAGTQAGRGELFANPTSNKIYAEVGYRRLCDWETIALEPAGTGR
jgi:hypothetical protein